jgi:hypothetical protein
MRSMGILFPPRAYTAAPLTRKNMPNCYVRTHVSDCQTRAVRTHQLERSSGAYPRPILILRSRDSGTVGVVDRDECNVPEAKEPPGARSVWHWASHDACALRAYRLPPRGYVVSELISVAMWMPEPHAFGRRCGDHDCNITRASRDVCLDAGARARDIWDFHHNFPSNCCRCPQDHSCLQLEACVAIVVQNRGGVRTSVERVEDELL